jgi:hypothetical protein
MSNILKALNLIDKAILIIDQIDATEEDNIILSKAIVDISLGSIPLEDILKRDDYDAYVAYNG